MQGEKSIAQTRSNQSSHAAELLAQDASTASTAELPAGEAAVTVLGTGASRPSKYRNVTGIYLDFGGRGGMLVDCGEGTWGQLVRCARTRRCD
jgi:hypothetical protein